MTQAANGEPGELTWRLSGVAAEPPKQVDESSKWPLLVVATGVVAVGGFMISRNASKRSNSRSKEPK